MNKQVARLSDDVIQQLKLDWMSDPSWDIEDTVGFEAHHEELKAWREKREQQSAELEAARLTRKAKQLGCSIELLGYIETLERQIQSLQRRTNDLEGYHN